jgi:hypothetical protein
LLKQEVSAVKRLEQFDIGVSSTGCDAFAEASRTDSVWRKYFQYAEQIRALNREQPDLTLDEIVFGAPG